MLFSTTLVFIYVPPAPLTNGRNNMPPWGDVLNPEDVEALWAYFSTGEK